MKFLRFLKSWWWQTPEKLVGGDDRSRLRSTQVRPRVHRKMLPVVRYLEKIHNRNSDLKFRYVGPNEMNGDAEELQVFISHGEQDHGLTIRYLDRLGLYFVDGPHNEKLHHETAREVLASLSIILAEVFPLDEPRNKSSRRDHNYQS